jgi:hypothetical protein
MQRLEKYLPDDSENTAGRENGTENCQSIVALLRRARRESNVDLLSHLAFKLNRWDAVHYIVYQMLDNGTDLRLEGSVPRMLPSNINWKALAPDGRSGKGLLARISSKVLDTVPDIPVGNANKAPVPVRIGTSTKRAERRQRELARATQAEIMAEFWRSLGLLVLTAADLPERSSLDAMEHFYRILARLQYLDGIPHDVYNAPPSGPLNRALSRAGMPYLQDQIMHTLADATLEAQFVESASRSAAPGSPAPQRRFKILRRELGVGTWLEFVLWCCIEGGFIQEACWILDQMRQRPKEWRLKSWSEVLQATGGIDPQKIEHFDTWAECGVNQTEHRLFLSRKPFLGMGDRTITSEVVVAIMDAILNSASFARGNRAEYLRDMSETIGSLRSMLKQNGIYLGTGDVNHLLARIIESEGIVKDTDPRSLRLPLDLFPYAIPEEARSSQALPPSLPKSRAVDHGHVSSALVLGLYSHTWNAYSSQGHIPGALEIFETLLGAQSPNKVGEMRRFALDDKHVIHASPVRHAPELQAQLLGDERLHTASRENLALQMLWQVSLSLFLDALTTSRAHRFCHWLLTPDENGYQPVPTAMFSDRLLAPAIIRFAASTTNPHLFAMVTRAMETPIPRETLKAMVTYEATILDWPNALRLLEYLPTRHETHWGATNIAVVAACIIALSKPSKFSVFVRKAYLKEAKAVLVALLEGRFNRTVSPAARPYRYQEQELYQMHRILESIPGPLEEACREAKLQWDKSHHPAVGVPANAFHHILAVVAETQGCLAAKRLWDLWCMDPFGPQAAYVRTGVDPDLFSMNNFLLPIHTESSASETPATSYESEAAKLVIPTLATVRIIAMRAIQEQTAIWRGTSDDVNNEPAKNAVREVLAWSIRMFERFGLTQQELEREMEGHLDRIRQESEVDS